MLTPLELFLELRTEHDLDVVLHSARELVVEHFERVVLLHLVLQIQYSLSFLVITSIKLLEYGEYLGAQVPGLGDLPDHVGDLRQGGHLPLEVAGEDDVDVGADVEVLEDEEENVEVFEEGLGFVLNFANVLGYVADVRDVDARRVVGELLQEHCRNVNQKRYYHFELLVEIDLKALLQVAEDAGHVQTPGRQ